MFYEKCTGYGHEAVTCKKLTGRKVWVQKKKPGEKGFTLVGKQKVRADETDIVLTTHNSFIALHNATEDVDRSELGPGHKDEGGGVEA